MTSFTQKLVKSNLSGVGIALILASLLFAHPTSNAQQMQQGVSVNMALTTHAQPMPAADDQDAWVVAVTADGRLYFGTKLLTADGLAEQMKTTPRRRDQNLYIKADARAQYFDVKKALEAARADLFEAPVLLTAQHEQVQPGTLVPPKGLAVLLSQPTNSEPAVVQIHENGEDSPTLEVNNQQIAWTNLQSALNQLLQNQTEKLVTLKADAQLPFAQLARVIDTCRSAKAKVILPTPKL